MVTLPLNKYYFSFNHYYNY